jgi:pyruvate dehydrogenase E2 component (dihydrolipoamide acetyltransferase)
MAEKVTLPLLGQTMEEGTIIKWFKKEGETVEKEEPLLEVMTDKANMEVESPAAGTLLKIVAQPDQTVPVKGLIAIIGSPGENIDALLSEGGAAEPPAPAAKEPAAGGSAAPAAVETPKPAAAEGGRIIASPRARKLAEDAGLDLGALAGAGSGPGGRIIEKDVQRAIEEQKAVAATPLARKVAAEAGVDLASVAGSGPGGKIQRADVEAATAPQAPTAPQASLAPRVSLGRVIPFSGLRKAVADNLEKSARSVIAVTLTLPVDMSETFRLREQVRPLYQDRYGVKLGYTDIIVKAAARAIEDFPILNSSLVGNEIRIHDSINVAVAVALPDGLMAPVVSDTNLKPLWSISAEIRDLAERAKAGKIGGADLAGGTFTVTNLGSYGIEQFNAIINPPQAAILAVCAIKEQPVVVNHEVVVRPVMNLCLTFDHRIIDGAPAAAYLARLKELLEQPYLILA